MDNEQGAKEKQCPVMERAKKSAGKVLTADQLWKGKHRERQITAVTSAMHGKYFQAPLAEQPDKIFHFGVERIRWRS